MWQSSRNPSRQYFRLGSTSEARTRRTLDVNFVEEQHVEVEVERTTETLTSQAHFHRVPAPTDAGSKSSIATRCPRSRGVQWGVSVPSRRTSREGN